LQYFVRGRDEDIVIEAGECQNTPTLAAGFISSGPRSIANQCWSNLRPSKPLVFWLDMGVREARDSRLTEPLMRSFFE